MWKRDNPPLFSYNHQRSGTVIFQRKNQENWSATCKLKPTDYDCLFLRCNYTIHRLSKAPHYSMKHCTLSSPLWILHKAANGYREVCSPQAESCFQRFPESIASPTMYRAIKSLLPHPSHHPILHPAVDSASTTSCSGGHRNLVRHNEKYLSTLLYFRHSPPGCIPCNSWPPSQSLDFTDLNCTPFPQRSLFQT